MKHIQQFLTWLNTPWWHIALLWLIFQAAEQTTHIPWLTTTIITIAITTRLLTWANTKN